MYERGHIHIHMFVYVCVCLYSTNCRPIVLLEGTPQMMKKETFGTYAWNLVVSPKWDSTQRHADWSSIVLLEDWEVKVLRNISNIAYFYTVLSSRNTISIKLCLVDSVRYRTSIIAGQLTSQRSFGLRRRMTWYGAVLCSPRLSVCRRVLARAISASCRRPKRHPINRPRGVLCRSWPSALSSDRGTCWTTLGLTMPLVPAPRG